MSIYKFLKNLLIIWIALGISISGYFFSFPDRISKYEYGARLRPSFQQIEMENDYSKAKLFLVITIVGTVLIVGFGKQSLNKEKD